MFKDFSSIFPWKPSQRSFILISDTLEGDGQGLPFHFMGACLQTGQNAALVGLSHIGNHYMMIGKKIGLALNLYQENGNYIFIDGMTWLAEQWKKHDNKNSHSDERNNEIEGDLLYDYILEKMNVKKGMCLVLDDLNVLLGWGWRYEQIIRWIGRWKEKLMEEEGTLILRMHHDHESNDENQALSLLRLRHWCDWYLKVDGLESGYSKDIHGQLSILRGGQLILSKGLSMDIIHSVPSLVHFKYLDSNMRFFAKGHLKEFF